MSACPDTEALCGLVEGRASDLDRESLERHLDGCASCRRALVEFGAMADSTAGSPSSRQAASGDPISAQSGRSSGSSSPSAPPSMRLSRYEIRREIAVGGMGVVYEGWDPALGRRVALKIMRPDIKSSSTTEQLATEARALAKVSHPNVITVFDVGIEGDAVFLAAEYVEGVTMDKGWPHRARSYKDRIDAYLQAARGLAAIHGAGITHRDIKPSNILLGNDGRVRVTDFGLAVGDGQRARAAGTPAYMAPEQRSGKASPRADQFSLAVCVAEALLGERFAAGTTADDLERVAKGAWGETPPPRALWETLAKALATDPAERFATVDAFASVLEATTRTAAASGRSVRTWYALGAAAGVILIGGALWASTTHAPAAPSDVSAATEASASGSSPAPEVASSGVAPTPSTTSSDDAAVASALALDELAIPIANDAAAPQGGGRASATASAPPPVTDPSAIMAKQQELTTILQDLPKAMAARDGKKCLALLDKAREVQPSVADGMSTTRGQCEMMAGRCEEGAKRLRASLTEAQVDHFRASYCPADSKGSTPQERLKAVGYQAAAPPFTAARCEQLSAQAEKAIKDHGKDKPDATAVAMARNNVAMCFAWVGDCKRTAAIVSGMVPAEDREEKVKKWVRQSHPNCANFGG